MRRRRTRGVTGPRVAAGAGGALQGDRGVGPRTLVESPGLGDARLALPLLLCSITGGADLQGPGVGARASLSFGRNALVSSAAALCQVKMTDRQARGAARRGHCGDE